LGGEIAKLRTGQKRVNNPPPSGQTPFGPGSRADPTLINHEENG